MVLPYVRFRMSVCVFVSVFGCVSVFASLGVSFVFLCFHSSFLAVSFTYWLGCLFVCFNYSYRRLAVSLCISASLCLLAWLSMSLCSWSCMSFHPCLPLSTCVPHSFLSNFWFLFPFCCVNNALHLASCFFPYIRIPYSLRLDFSL